MKPIWLLVAVLTLAGCDPVSRVGAPATHPDQLTITGIYDGSVTLTDGQYTGEPFVPGGASRPQVTLLDAPRWHMDLDANGRDETLVLLVESSGGSGSFVYLAVLPGSAAISGAGDGTAVRAHPLGDRVEVPLMTLAADGLLKVMTRSRVRANESSEMRLLQFAINGGELHPLAAVSGWLRFGHEVREFMPCGYPAEQALWVSERQPGELRELLGEPGPEPYAPVFVNLLGTFEPAPAAEFASAYSEQIRVAAINRLEREGPGCKRDLAGAAVRAFGEEPFWSLSVYPDRFEFNSLANGVSVFEAAPSAAGWQVQAGELVAALSGTNDVGQPLELALEAARCVDTMAGNLYAWRAQLSIAGQDLRGCAITALMAGP